MIEVGCLTLPPHVADLQREQNNLRDEMKEASKDKRRKLLLEYAEKCEALGHWYRQEGDKRRAKGDKKNARYCKNSAQGEFEQANKTRQDVAQT